MALILVLLIIGLPWLGALVVWQVGDQRPRWQHGLAVGFSAAAGLAALALLPFAGAEWTISLPAGGSFGDFTFTPDGLGVFLAVVATVIGSLAVVFSIDYMKGEDQLGRYYALVLVFHWRYGRVGADQQPAVDVLLLGDYRSVFVRIDLIL